MVRHINYKEQFIFHNCWSWLIKVSTKFEGFGNSFVIYHVTICLQLQ